MLFLVNKERKTIFGWSAKCACSHIKNMFYFLQSGIFCEPNQSVHRGKGLDFQPLPENLGEYTIILFIRNPYKRLVSGFLDKYKKDGEFRELWTIPAPLKFSNFVDALYYKSTMIDRHHFTPQTSEHFNDDIRNHSKTFIFDIDGVLTDAGMYYTEEGDEFKKFNAKDGLAIRQVKQRGINTGIISHGYNSKIVSRRAERLHIELVEVSQTPKLQTLNKWCGELNISPMNVCFIGDDINDEDILRAVGFSACPGDAVNDVKNMVHVVLNKKGGEGCVRELIDLYL